MVISGTEISDRIKSRIKQIPRKDEVGFMTVQEMSIECGFDKSTLNSILNSYTHINDKQLDELAKHLFCSKEYIITGCGSIYEIPRNIITPYDRLNENLSLIRAINKGFNMNEWTQTIHS